MTREKTTIQFDPSAFSSRKLLEVASTGHASKASPTSTPGRAVTQAPVEAPVEAPVKAAVNELTRRGHYLTELVDRGLISLY